MSSALAVNNLDDWNTDQLSFNIQGSINRARRELDRNWNLNLTGNKSDSYTDVNSLSGSTAVSSIVHGIDITDVEEMFDPRVWLQTEEVLLVKGSVSSTPSVKKAGVSEWVSYIQNDLSYLKGYKKLAERIQLLANDIEINDGISINEESLSTFVMFLASNRINKKPSIGLSSRGYIDALWRNSQGRLVEIIFSPGHESQIVTFSNDLVNPDVMNKRVATLPIKNIMDVISSRNLSSLLRDKKAIFENGFLYKIA